MIFFSILRGSIETILMVKVDKNQIKLNQLIICSFLI